jgi:thioredoxin:protein disulfide reductase
LLRGSDPGTEAAAAGLLRDAWARVAIIDPMLLPKRNPQRQSPFVPALALALALITGPAAVAADPPPIPSEIVRLRVESADYSPAHDALSVVLLAEIADGWHVNAHQPASDALVPTTLTVIPPPGFEVGAIEYPQPEKRRLRFAGGEVLEVYSGRVRLRIPVSVRTAFTKEGASFQAKLHYQPCDDTRCLRPTDAERAFVVRHPGDLEASAAGPSTNQAPVEDWLVRYGLATTLALVFAMGLGLNLTPCVYPLISVTIAYFGGQARARRSHTVLLSAVYALGIALTFSALGVSAALSGGLFGRALQNPPTLIAIAALMVALALSSFGLYTLQPPAWILQKAGGAGRGLAGAFFMGLTMGIVAAPCVGPIVVGLLVAVGARGDAALGFLLFFTLALGLGAPYVVLGSAAGSIARLPRAGEWLVWIERLFGFLLLGLALYFVSPLLERQILRWATAGLLACAGITLGFLDLHDRRLVYFARFKRVVGALAVVVALWVALPPARAKPEGISWSDFSAHALEQASSNGRPVVVDFRADWCMPCIEMELTTFVSPEVTAKTAGFVMLRADVTEMSKDAEKLLSRYGVLGVPTTIFFASNGREHRRMVGYIDADQFARLLDDTRSRSAEGGSTRGQGRPAG